MSNVTTGDKDPNENLPMSNNEGKHKFDPDCTIPNQYHDGPCESQPPKQWTDDLGDYEKQTIEAATANSSNSNTTRERKDYANLAKEFGLFRIGKYGIKFLPDAPTGQMRKLFSIIPLTGWITDPDEVARQIRENGMEL